MLTQSFKNSRLFAAFVGGFVVFAAFALAAMQLRAAGLTDSQNFASPQNFVSPESARVRRSNLDGESAASFRLLEQPSALSVILRDSLRADSAANLLSPIISGTAPNNRAAVAANPANCTYGLSRVSFSFASSAGSRSTSLSTQSGCQWNAVSSAPWLTVTNPVGTMTGTSGISFTATANTTGTSRQATITAGGQTLFVTQTATGCSYDVGNAAYVGSAASSNNSLLVYTQDNCSWKTNTETPWITFPSAGFTFLGNGIATFNVGANTGGPRDGAIILNDGQSDQATKLVVQSAASGMDSCQYLLGASSATVDQAGGTYTVNVTTQTGCGWTIDNLPSWLSITSGAPGTGSGTFNYTASANRSRSARSGVIAVGGNRFTVNQRAGVPTSGKIAFYSDRTGSGDIYTLDPANPSAAPVRLTTDSNPDLEPAYSADGSRIAFVRSTGGVRRLMIMNADGTNQTEISAAGTQIVDPAWSPDGTHVAYATTGGSTAILKIRIQYTSGGIPSGSSPVTLINNPGFDGYPAWSPDGTRIAFANQAPSSGKVDIYVMSSADGSNAVRLTTTPVASIQNLYPRWSPDGTKIVYSTLDTSIANQIHHEIYQINADGTGTPLRLDGDGLQPTFSPDGTKIAFSRIYYEGLSVDVGNYEILVMNADGSNQLLLTDDNLDLRDVSPSWETVYTQKPQDPCIYSATPPTAVVNGVGAARLTFKVNAAPGCSWVASGSDAWLGVTLGTGSGSGEVIYAVGSNTTGAARHGTISVNGIVVFSVTQNQQCTYSVGSVSPSFTFPAAGGNGSVAVTTQPGCQWSISENGSWYSISGNTLHTGSGTANFTVAPNASVSRNGFIDIAGVTSSAALTAYFAQETGAGVCSQTPAPIAFGSTVNDALTTSDCVLEGHYTDQYSFSGTAGQKILIRMASATLQEAVTLHNSAATQIYANHNNSSSSGTPDARIPSSGNDLYTLPVTGTYIISAAHGSSFSPSQTGSYALTLHSSDTVPSPPAPSGIVAWLAGEGDARNLQNAATNGTFQNGVGYFDQFVGQSFDFNGTNQFVEIPHDASFNSNSITVEGWVRTDQTGSARTIASKSNGADGAASWSLDQNADGTLSFTVYGTSLGNYRRAITYSSLPTTNNQAAWRHIAATFDHTTQTTRIYSNGSWFGYTNSGGANLAGVAQTGAPVRLGASQTGGAVGNFFDGKLDEVSIYNRVLTQIEINSIYDAGRKGKLKQATLTNQTTVALASTTVTFPAATSGTVTETPIDAGSLPALPAGFESRLAFDVSTTAAFSGNATVCFAVPSISTADFVNLKVFHREESNWVDRTASGNSYPNLCASTPSFSPFVVARELAPLSATAAISGLVRTTDGRGIRGALVTLTEASGATRTTLSGAGGAYRFADVEVGQSVFIAVRSKRFNFAAPTQIVNVTEDVGEVNFAAQ